MHCLQLKGRGFFLHHLITSWVLLGVAWIERVRGRGRVGADGSMIEGEYELLFCMYVLDVREISVRVSYVPVRLARVSCFLVASATMTSKGMESLIPRL